MVRRFPTEEKTDEENNACRRVGGRAHDTASVCGGCRKHKELEAGEELRNGYNAENLIDTKVRSPNGEEIGEIENLIVGPDGKLKKIVFATGGVLGIGDKHLAVDWKDVKVGPGIEFVTVPLTQGTANQYGIFDGMPERVNTGPRAFRASELLGDYVRLKGGVNYGYVRDLMFTQAGELKAIIVNPDVDYATDRGYYAYPFRGYDYGWNPGADYYDLPYDRSDIAQLGPFEYRS